MASTFNRDILAFLDDVLSTMTNLHVVAARYAGEPEVQAAFDDLASVPGALIEQAQQLRAQLLPAAVLDRGYDGGADEKPKAKAKAAAKK